MSGDLLMFTSFVFYSLYDMFLIWGRSQLYAVVTGTCSPIVCMFVYFVWSHSGPLFVLLWAHVYFLCTPEYLHWGFSYTVRVRASSGDWQAPPHVSADLAALASKSSGLCTVCHATRQLHLKGGTMHKLGPEDNLCHPPDYIFKPAAIETVGPHNASALNFPSKVGRQLTSLSGDSCETSFLFQRFSTLIQCFNSADYLWIHLASLTKTWDSNHQWCLFLASSFLTPGIYTTIIIIILITV